MIILIGAFRVAVLRLGIIVMMKPILPVHSAKMEHPVRRKVYLWDFHRQGEASFLLVWE